MPLSSGILIGLVLALIGAGLYWRTRSRRLPLLLVGAGLLLAASTLAVIVLAVNSM